MAPWGLVEIDHTKHPGWLVLARIDDRAGTAALGSLEIFHRNEIRAVGTTDSSTLGFPPVKRRADGDVTTTLIRRIRLGAMVSEILGRNLDRQPPLGHLPTNRSRVDGRAVTTITTHSGPLATWNSSSRVRGSQ
jgi:hypothetical protein